MLEYDDCHLYKNAKFSRLIFRKIIIMNNAKEENQNIFILFESKTYKILI
jgi:hypothetical protein